MNRFIYALLIVTGFSTSSMAQTLKISGVDASEPQLYDKASKALGKTLTLTFYDNSVSVTSPGQSGTLNLKKDTETQYLKVEETNSKSSTYKLTLTKTFGVITSVTLGFSYQKKYQPNESGWSTLTAKRF
jgi:hypothetical protein